MCASLVFVQRSQPQSANVAGPVIAWRHRGVLHGGRTNKADLAVIGIVSRRLGRRLVLSCARSRGRWRFASLRSVSFGGVPVLPVAGTSPSAGSRAPGSPSPARTICRGGRIFAVAGLTRSSSTPATTATTGTLGPGGLRLLGVRHFGGGGNVWRRRADRSNWQRIVGMADGQRNGGQNTGR